MWRFGGVTGGLVTLLAGAVVWQGAWVWAALAAITVFAAIADKLGGLEAPDQPQAAGPTGPWVLLVVLALCHMGLLAGGVIALTTPEVPWAQKGALFVALSLFAGQVGHPVAHELIHHPGRGSRRLGRALYCTVLFGQHASTHMRVHHVHVATDADPNSAPKGEGFWRFAARAWLQGTIAGWRAEKRLGPKWHPYLGYAAGAVVTLLAAYSLAGRAGVVWIVAIASYAQLQILLSDYVQHYGLRRALTEKGKPEPVGPQHSWNAPDGFSSAMMVNAPRHSDHHMHPGKAYPDLALDRSAMPLLPYTLPIMAVLALVPPLWRKVMDPRLAQIANHARL